MVAASSLPRSIRTGAALPVDVVVVVARLVPNASRSIHVPVGTFGPHDATTTSAPRSFIRRAASVRDPSGPSSADRLPAVAPALHAREPIPRSGASGAASARLEFQPGYAPDD